MPPKSLPERPVMRPWLGPAGIAIVATLAALLTLAPEGNGPGVACDELYHVDVGKRLVTAWRQQGLAFFSPRNIRRNFAWTPDGPPVHPPLGNWILGWTHHLFDPAPNDPRVISIHTARFAPALALGALVFLVGLFSAATEGPLAGAVAAAATLLVPRVFGHAHFAALDTLTALSFVAAVLAAAWSCDRGARPWQFALAGFLWGLAMLTRLHGLLAAPPIVLWVLWRMRRKAVLPLLTWSTVGVATLFAGWPWLWLAPWANLRQFLGTSTGRQVIHVFYLGQAWADRDVPRHYALVMFLAVLPLGLLLLGCAGIWAKRRDWKDAASSFWALVRKPPLDASGATAKKRPQEKKNRRNTADVLQSSEDRSYGHMLIVGTLVFLMFVLSWPGTPVYDGVRLLLMVFPLWAVLTGTGAKWVVNHAGWGGVQRTRRLAAIGLFVALQSVGIVAYHPCHLSHYGLLVGGLWGAEKLGFEVTYWGETVREPLLAEAAARAPDSQAFFVPNLAPFQAVGVNLSSPSLLRQQTELIGWDERLWRSSKAARYAIVYHRRADATNTTTVLSLGRVIAESSKQGVWLARLVEVPPVTATTCKEVGQKGEKTGAPAGRALDGKP